MKASKDTIFALATQKGKSGIAVFRVSGKGSHTIIKSISSKKKFKTNFATLNDLLDGKSVVDQTLTTFFKSPKSYTGEDMVEISCHGSISVINKITKTLLKKRIRLAEPGEFTKRALMNDKLSVLEAETINDLVNAETENQRKIAIGNLSGNLDKLVNEITRYEQILHNMNDKKHQKLESKNKKQRALQVNAFDALVLNILSCYTIPSMFEDVQAKAHDSE